MRTIALGPDEAEALVDLLELVACDDACAMAFADALRQLFDMPPRAPSAMQMPACSTIQ